MSDHESKSSRIAIQLGNPPGASSNGIRRRARPAYGKRHRAHVLQGDSESEDETATGEQTYGRLEAIASYGPSGASTDDEKLRIRGDRAERDDEMARHQHGDTRSNGRDEADQQKDDGLGPRHGDSAPPSDLEAQSKPIRWGLTINKKANGGAKDGKEGDTKSRTGSPGSEEASRKEEQATKNIDDEAMDALIGQGAPKRKRLDSDAADREPQLEDYQSVPVDDFGATLLRRFGWDGKMRGKVKEVTRHANLTGLGAKNVKEAEDLGAWNQKTARDSRPVRLNDYHREERKKRERIDDRYRDSYKRERERERERERGRDR
ncbi:hypothetical protein VTK56DRAFT_8490 [Thermocarpiscus australiensis]